MQQQVHAGHKATGRTGGALQRKIIAAEVKLLSVPLADRDEDWAATIGGVRHANDLLSQGRRAKAGKVLASAIKAAEAEKS